MSRRLTQEQAWAVAGRAVDAIISGQPTIGPTMLRRILVTLARIESNYDTLARNPSSSARGIMQILAGTQRWLEQRLGMKPQPREALDNPLYSMILAADYLAWLYATKANRQWDRAIVAYNQGHYNTSAAGAQYLTKATQAYNAVDWGNYRPSAAQLAVNITKRPDIAGRYYREFI